jgi:hypothetical protein
MPYPGCHHENPPEDSATSLSPLGLATPTVIAVGVRKGMMPRCRVGAMLNCTRTPCQQTWRRSNPPLELEEPDTVRSPVTIGVGVAPSRAISAPATVASGAGDAPYDEQGAARLRPWPRRS